MQYACRKTLADSRPRVRGRFAKNDELCEAAQSGSQSHEHYEQTVSFQLNYTQSYQTRTWNKKKHDSSYAFSLFLNKNLEYFYA
jgi:hypothetical protein